MRGDVADDSATRASALRAVNRARRSGSLANASGRTLIATSRSSFVSRRAIHLPHAAFADLRGDFVDAEAGAGSEGQTLVVDYTGRSGSADGITPE